MRTRIFLIVALLAALAQAQDHKTLQPGESAVVNVDGKTTTFTAATQPTPPPDPTDPPTTQPSDPTDPVPYPPTYSYIAQPGSDLAKLPEHATLITGTYVTSGNVTKNVVGQPGTVPVLELRSGQCPKYGDIFAGVVVNGGGKSDSDELKTAGPIAAVLTHSCTFTNSAGFGLLTSRSGQVRVTQCRFINNQSGGIGGTGSSMDVLVDNCYFENNNWRYKRTNSQKFTRGTVMFRDCHFVHNFGGGVWADNYVKRLSIIRCKFEQGQKDKSGDRWTAFDVRGEISDQMLIKDCLFDNDITASISVDEIKNGTVIEGSRFVGSANMAIELRNDARDGYFLRNVVIRHNDFATNVLDIVPSGSKAPTLSGNNIVVETNNTWPDGKVAPHVKVKP